MANNRYSVGIDAMVSGAPSVFVSSQVLADDLGMKVEDVEGQGIKGFTWPSLSQGNATMYADGLYTLMKVISSGENAERLERNPVKYVIHSSETNSGSIPDSVYGMLPATSRLLEEDESKYTPIVTQLYQALPVPITFNCAGGGIGLKVGLNCIIAEMQHTGERASAVLSTIDTSVYDETFSGPRTTMTQGAAYVLMHLTFEPRVMEVDMRSFSSYVFPEPGFSKFANSHIPHVVPRISRMSYTYALGQATHLQEEREGGLDDGRDEFAALHRPLGDQVMGHTAQGAVHTIRKSGGEAWRALREKIGEPPTEHGGGYTELFDSKLYALNRGEVKLTQRQTIDSLQQDKDLYAYWKWSQKIREQSVFTDFLNRLHIPESLRKGEKRGNGYSASAPQGVACVIDEVDLKRGATGRVFWFGSESVGLVNRMTLMDDTANLRGRLVLDFPGSEISATLEQYRGLKPILSKREGERTVTEKDLRIEDLAFFKRDRLTNGFHYINRNIDGTGRWAIARDGRSEEVFPRYVAPLLKKAAKQTA